MAVLIPIEEAVEDAIAHSVESRAQMMKKKILRD